MPIYTFKCEKCQKSVDLLQNFGDSNPSCDCSEDNVVMDRLIPMTGRPKFSGSGFYETDYKKHSKKSLKKTNDSKGKKNE